MKMLITGAGGKLAGEVAQAFASDYDLAYMTRRSIEGLPPGTQHILDLADSAEMERVFAAEKPDAVIHLGAMLPAACQENPELARQVNVEATAELARLAVAHNVQSFVFASTAAVYNQTEMKPVTEDEAASEPRLVYGQTKLAAEKELEAAATTGDTRFTALRIFNIYGRPFTDSLVNKLAHSTEQAPVGLVGPDTFVRDYVHVDDVVAAHRAVLERHDSAPAYRVYNIASGVPTSNGDLVQQLEAQGIHPHYTMRPIDLNVAWADISRARTELGFNPQTSIRVD